MKWKIQMNKKFGYYEVIPKPSQEVLNEYYSAKYYQNEKATYSHEYSDEELEYFKNKNAEKYFVIDDYYKSSKKKGSMLDIGCGEGFTMKYFMEKGWYVTGIDFSSYGLIQNHPELSNCFVEGDIFTNLDQFEVEKRSYDVIWLDNVLEHVIEPESLLKKCFKLTKEGGILVIEVPHDFSDFQSELFNSGKVDRKYWEAYPDHLSYFNRDSLISLAESVEWKCLKLIADFPIEWTLANSNSNYVNQSTFGKAAHRSRVYIDNFIHKSNDMNVIIDFYESLSKIGQGRQLIGFFSKKDE